MPCEYKDNLPILKDIHQPYGLAQRKALIRYFFGTVPKGIEEFAEQWGQLDFAMQFDSKLRKQEVKKG